jgi:hypothetical protein
LFKNSLPNLPATPFKLRDTGPVLPDQANGESVLTTGQQDAIAKLQAEQVFGKSLIDSTKSFAQTVQDKYGSLGNNISANIAKLGDPNAPPYTGTDPIVRKRLGLPPIEG